MIIFALNRIDRTTLVEAKDFVAQVQSVSKETEPFVDAVATLNVELCVSIEIVIACRVLLGPKWVVECGV